MSQASLPRALGRRLGIAAMIGMIQACSPQQPPLEQNDTAPASTSQAERQTPIAEPAVYRGAALAQQVCVRCHDIGISGAAPAIPVGAPDFVFIANQDGMTTSYLQQWMRSSHPSMPNYLFNDSTVDDVAAYIMSLHRQN